MRCALCGNRDRHARDGGWDECTHCAMRYRPDCRPADAIARDLETRFAAPRLDLVADPPGDWLAAPYTVRVAGYRHGRAVSSREGETTYRLTPLGHQGPPIALGMLARPADLSLVHRRIAPLRPHFAQIVVLIDDIGPAPSDHGDIRHVTHPIEGDFAGQRNRLHTIADTPWMLQIDADETIAPELLAALPGLAADADRNGLHSLAFPRRNMVDGIASDLWPDVQYRLNRTGEPYVGRVHERPAAAADWSRSALAPAGVIVHHLTAAHVRARTRLYGAMAADGARPEDEAALLRPFSPD